MTVLVSQARWQKGGQLGCCGIGTVARLKACYPEPADITRHLLHWREATRPQILRPRHDSLDVMIKQIQRFPFIKEVHSTTYGLPSVYFKGTAIPLEMAFASVIDSMLTCENYGLWFLSDNVSGAGDHHSGEFSTRAFVRWCKDKDLGAWQTSGPVTSWRTTRDIQGWIFTMHKKACRSVVEVHKDTLLKMIKEWNSNEQVKSKGQAAIHAHVTESRELTAGFDDAWSAERG